METSSSLAQALLHLAFFLAIPALYVAVAWLVYRRWGRHALTTLWIGASLLAGYFAYRYVCSQPLTCDVGGTSDLFLSGSPYYFVHYVPQFSGISAVAFGAATLVVWRRLRLGSSTPLWPGTLILGSAAAVGAYIIVMVALGLLGRLTDAAA